MHSFCEIIAILQIQLSVMFKKKSWFFKSHYKIIGKVINKKNIHLFISLGPLI